MLFFVLFLVGTFTYFIPHINTIEGKKTSLVDSYNSLKKLQKLWPTYSDVQSFVSRTPEFKTEFYTVLLENVSKEFYNDFFINETDAAYNDFLQSYESQLSKSQQEPEVKKRDQIVNSIIPYYGWGYGDSDESLSDFHFINYVENLLYNFNISSQWDIWIWSLEAVDTLSTGDNSLFNNEIFKIPLSFQVLGRKDDIIDFIHFFENVGAVEVENNTIKVYNDTFIGKTIEGDKPEGREYSIYNNQISDIATITIQDYLDSSSIRWSGNLIERIQKSQSREGISIDITLNFYVAGIPGYKMREAVNEFFSTFDKLHENIIDDAWEHRLQVSQESSWSHIQAVNGLEWLASLIWSLWWEIQDIRSSIWNREDISELYKEVIAYQKQLMRIQESYTLYLDTLSK